MYPKKTSVYTIGVSKSFRYYDARFLGQVDQFGPDGSVFLFLQPGISDDLALGFLDPPGLLDCLIYAEPVASPRKAQG